MKIKEDVTKRLVNEGVCISMSQARKLQIQHESIDDLERYISRKRNWFNGNISPHSPNDSDYDIMHL